MLRSKLVLGRRKQAAATGCWILHHERRMHLNAGKKNNGMASDSAFCVPLTHIESYKDYLGVSTRESTNKPTFNSTFRFRDRVHTVTHLLTFFFCCNITTAHTVRLEHRRWADINVIFYRISLDEIVHSKN